MKPPKPPAKPPIRPDGVRNTPNSHSSSPSDPLRADPLPNGNGAEYSLLPPITIQLTRPPQKTVSAPPPVALSEELDFSALPRLLEEKISLEVLRKERYQSDETAAKYGVSRTEIAEVLPSAADLKRQEIEFIDLSDEEELLDTLDSVGFQGAKMIGFVDTPDEERYRIDPIKLPPMAFFFSEQEIKKTFNEKERIHKTSKQAPKKTSESKGVTREFNQAPSKMRKLEFPIIFTPRLKVQDRKRLKISKDEEYRTFESIKKDSKRVKFKTELNELQKVRTLEEKWKEVTNSVLKVMKFFQRTDFDQNAKNLALSCAKIKRKTFTKTKKTTKEYAVRAKKLWKETQVFWKRRTKELNDLKKKKEKLEQEKKKKEEEKQEQLRQRKKIEFLIQKSSIYAEIMAKKLGNESEFTPSGNVLEPLTLQETEEAKSDVNHIIEENKKRVNEFNANVQPVDFSQVELGNESALVEIPTSFKGTLKEYQFKGLRWLDSLYSQGINGILADEMGLGKTIQAIALLAHISEKKDNWGPFLVIAPATTLFNWHSECLKFCPQLRVLPFWGSKNERQVFRRNLQQRHLGVQDSEFHIVITSYQIAVSDEKILQRVNWQYIILDEAQAIKNMNSQRWAKLLELKSRNKLLLTGTPIQNTMAELWSLLHFIMPQLFDSHEQFQEWFSKDIEAHSQNKQKLNKTQLNRLHAILKPFMLRRVKKDVEKEIGKKFETEVYCELSSRQKILYEGLRKKISLTDFFYMKENREKVENLMNLVMQLKKVCNHTELFERKIVKAPLFLSTSLADEFHTIYSNAEKVHLLRSNSVSNPFTTFLPKLVFEISIRSFRRLKLIERTIFDFSRLAGINELMARLIANTSDMKFLYVLTAAHYMKHTEFIFTSTAEQKKEFRPFSVRVPLKSNLEITNFSLKQVLLPLISKCNEICVPAVVANPIRSLPAQPRPLQTVLMKLSPHIPFLIDYPQFDSLISDSSKLSYLDHLLKKLKFENQRALVFCQMTKMLDILEEFLQYRKYKYLRLDGGCQITDRRDMVNEFQDNKEIFIFLLSTRAGGLGVTLTAADVVIFYDNDWNPTMDAQAADRAHRIGRTRDVYVYRLITKGTIEERIVRRAQQKSNVQQTVYSGEVFKGNVFRTHDVMSLLFDEQEIKEREKKEILSKAEKKGKKKKEEEKKLDVINEEAPIEEAEIVDLKIVQRILNGEENIPTDNFQDAFDDEKNRKHKKKHKHED